MSLKYKSIGSKTAGAIALSVLMLTPLLRSDSTNNVEKVPKYDITMGEILDQDTKSMHINIMAVKQKGAVAAAYLLNGMGDNNIWYQFGLACDRSDEYSFSVVAEAWKDGKVLFNKKVRVNVEENTQLLLGMDITNNMIVMQMYPFNWPGPLVMKIPSMEATKFERIQEGDRAVTNSKTMYFSSIGTSIMTEIYTDDRNINISPQWYQITKPGITNAVIPTIMVSTPESNNGYIDMRKNMEMGISTVVPPGLHSPEVHFIGKGNLNVFYQNGNLFTTQSSTNFSLPGK